MHCTSDTCTACAYIVLVTFVHILLFSVQNEIHQFFSFTTGTDTSGVAVSEFLNSPAMQTVMASWTKLHLKVSHVYHIIQ